MKKLLYPFILLVLIFSIGSQTSDLHARKFKFAYNKGKSGKIRVIKSFITSTSRVAGIKARSNRIKQGEKIHFYYKVGPLKCKKGKGTPFKTRLVIKRGNKTLKDFGWQNGNAASGSQKKRNQTLRWYHSAKWNLALSRNIRPGNYTAIVSHKDINSGKTLKITYRFIIEKSSTSGSASGNYSVDDFINAFKRNDINRCMEYVGKRVGTYSRKSFRGILIQNAKLYKDNKEYAAKHPNEGPEDFTSIKKKNNSTVAFSPNMGMHVYYWHFRMKGKKLLIVESKFVEYKATQ